VNVQLAAAPINVGDEIIGAMAIYTDVSERIKAERAIRESQARYEHIFQDAGVAIWVEDFSAVKAAID